jgi:hypothetical protein
MIEVTYWQQLALTVPIYLVLFNTSDEWWQGLVQSLVVGIFLGVFIFV